MHSSNFDLNEYLSKKNKYGQVKRVTCNDGFSVSIQASRYHYCSPRDDEGWYYQVELGFPSDEPTDAIMQYADDPSDPTETVYGYVPISLVVDLLELHGGAVVENN